ncbi:DUF2357 domain-containing protein [Duganella sp. FT27W]|nr:DUF2357 domain-containing protein [Duganella sp. FT27W]
MSSMSTLTCHVASGVSFTVSPESSCSEGFYEGGRYAFVLQSESTRILVIDDMRLPCRNANGDHRWEWTPQFYAGTVIAELFDERGVRLAVYHLEVAPPAKKLAKMCFHRMVVDLRSEDPELLFGAEPGGEKISSEGDFSNIHLQYARLKLFGDRYLRALKKITIQPLSALKGTRSSAPLHRVRRIDTQTLRSLARNPGAMAQLGNIDGVDSITIGMFDVPVSSVTLDTAAHRTLKTILNKIIRHINAVRMELRSLAANEQRDQVRTSQADRLALRELLLDDLEDGLQKLKRARPFSEVTRDEISSAGLNAISGHPDYARAFRLGWQILRPGIDGPGSDEILPVSPTWEIYERWCFLRVVVALKHIFPELVWSRKVGGKADRIKISGEGKDIQVRAFLQKTFPAFDKKHGLEHFYSNSAQRRPDIVVTVTNGPTRKIIVFDAKYCVSRDSILEAMSSAHIYRDSLRWGAASPDYALLLVPAGGGVAALEQPWFIAENKVGVIPLSPLLGEEHVISFLSRTLLAGTANSIHPD